MAKPKPSTISRDPYTADPYAFIGTPAKKEDLAPVVAPATKPEAAKPEQGGKAPVEKITTPFPVDLIERARNAAYWERATLTGIVVQALADALDKMEADRGEAYPPRTNQLRGGRPVGSGKARNASNT
jgi:hypothetical protein